MTFMFEHPNYVVSIWDNYRFVSGKLTAAHDSHNYFIE